MFIQKWHPAAEAFPLMQGDKFQEFVDDIRAHGVLKPLEYYDGDRWPEFKGVGIDGRNRQKACELLNLEPPLHRPYRLRRRRKSDELHRQRECEPAASDKQPGWDGGR